MVASFILALILSFILASCSSQDAPSLDTRSYAYLQGDTLRIGNSLVGRTFLWNGGNLETLEVTSAGKSFAFADVSPDQSIVKGTVSDGAFVSDEFDGGVRATVSWKQGGIDVKRIYTVRDGVPAIACDTYLRGIGRNYDRYGAIDRLNFPDRHWKCKAVAFRDSTDWHDNLVMEETFASYRKMKYRGNLLFMEGTDGQGFFFLKESPNNEMQLAYNGYDFVNEYGRHEVVGSGILPEDIVPGKWTKAYSTVLGVYDGTELGGLSALRAYQKSVSRPMEDQIMLNTWGDRSQDSRVNETFCLAELDYAARLGITTFQIDDGWQRGKSPNGIFAGGTFSNIWKSGDYWTVDKDKFPRGLHPVVEKAKSLGISLGLWFNPSKQDDFADWEKDADAILALWKEYGICIFKIDGLVIPSLRADENLHRLFDKVVLESGGEVIFNLDVTAGIRGGYHYFREYGNIFLENRYTDWGNYYPYRTLRNLWMLSRYVPAENLQIEFLNNRRNNGVYPADDPFAPANYSFEYLFAVTMAGQPLAWFEASGLDEDAFEAAPLIRRYREFSEDFHSGVILPIGSEPDGRAWTGFQSITSPHTGYVIVYRELSDESSAEIPAFLPSGARLTLIAGSGSAKLLRSGSLKASLPAPNSFAVFAYR